MESTKYYIPVKYFVSMWLFPWDLKFRLIFPEVSAFRRIFPESSVFTLCITNWFIIYFLFSLNKSCLMCSLHRQNFWCQFRHRHRDINFCGLISSLFISYFSYLVIESHIRHKCVHCHPTELGLRYLTGSGSVLIFSPYVYSFASYK